jgi:ATP-dependent DNA helicase RecG
MQEDDILHRLELLDDDEPNNTAVAMFGKKATAEIQMAIFATEVKHTFIDIDRKKGTIIDMVDAGEMYIRRNIRWRVVRDGSPARVEIPEVPLEAVREALLNSYAHRDWRVSQTNEIAIYSNRIEIYNPGTFPDGLTPQDFIDGAGKSIRRNPLLAQIMYYSKDIESFGTGLRKIATECEGAGVRYGFELSKLGFSVIFYRPDLYGEPTADGCESAGDGNDGNRDGNADDIITLISANARITYKGLAESLGISEATVMRRVRELKDSGRLRRRGSTRGEWEISNGND